MEEALRIRLILEPLAAERSCQRRPESALPKVRRLLDSLQASVEKPKKYMMKNSQFHFAIYSYADSPWLLQMIDWLWARVAPYFVIYVTREDVLSPTIKVHQEMFEAFVHKDKKKIKDAIRRDLENAARVIIPLLEIPTQN
jgi:DNA-binding GntR family transcriptional regulator